MPGVKIKKWWAVGLKGSLVLGCLVLGWMVLSGDNRVLAKAVLRLSPVKAAQPSPESPAPPKAAGPTEGQVYGLVLKVEPASQSHASKPLGRPMAESQEALQRVTIRLEGSLKTLGLQSDIIQVENVLGENPFYNIRLKPGAQVLLQAEKEVKTGQWHFNIANHNRTPALMILMTLTIMAILLLGGVEVAKHALLVTLMLIGCYKALFPAVLAGEHSPWWIFLMCGMFTILATFIYQQPGQKAFSREQCVVMLGTTGGLLILAAILWAMGEITPLSGYSSELLASLWYRSPQMDYWAFFMAGMLFAYQGFLFYLCWTLAQNRKESEPVSFQKRFGIVMLRGRRLMGPLISCLGLLFLGLFMPILLQMQGTPTAQFVNLESTASMMTFAFAGALTLILTVPLTALIAAWLLADAPATDAA
ncbi:YibE/F family protein [Vampirovibrio chlorellavorus]|uniref:YibE/F family protein n=1 Tax=Vampirovibrio chlorellavorus TaxID=758823 RepID=UPI0026F1F853|nr:YibE/F family protein [Vampirovibrio chlorellavorus]